MAKICWVVPKIKRDKFTGGMYCILRHADGLARLGHDVSVVPLQNSSNPAWFKGGRFSVELASKWQVALRTFRAERRGGRYQAMVHSITSGIATIDPRMFSFPIRHSVMCERARSLLPYADITIATSFETVLPVYLHGKGVLAYYAQHFEPFFLNEFDDPKFAEAIARSSYRMPTKIITNSTWLEKTISSEVGVAVHAVAGNAISEGMFSDEPAPMRNGSLRVISYGGRDAAWKGFSDMAEGVRMARAHGVQIEWSVYGDCIMSPDNTIAPFKSLGFLNPDQLAAAYRRSHVLLSSSWYESFPLFPLEAMASGLAVITTQAGTEAFARHMENAWIVSPKSPNELCVALVRLAGDDGLRFSLGTAAMKEARNHTWGRAVERMERVLLNLL